MKIGKEALCMILGFLLDINGNQTDFVLKYFSPCVRKVPMWIAIKNQVIVLIYPP